ncbi:hypothetical protein [Ewingella americana]|uniref:DUF2867 domain-containing protein n=1 Tax=Ewingella americana TaxID=41202 RepID=A0A502GIL4_9GAMM|nr:hypothetical protein [Ewingella americana]TPG60796.1 hypothetical protein EAH77_14415 [Ewingella americana]
MFLNEKYLPVYQFNEKHSLNILAPPADIMAAVLNFCPQNDWLIRYATAVRELPIRLLDLIQSRPASSRQAFGMENFTLLEKKGDRELAFGLAGKFWKTDYGQTTIKDAAEFLAFSEPGTAKLVLSFTIEKLNETHTQLTTETRVFCLDRNAQRSFTPYWYLIRPVSGLIRLRILKAISQSAKMQNFQPH